jgi:hypothetical protein
MQFSVQMVVFQSHPKNSPSDHRSKQDTCGGAVLYPAVVSGQWMTTPLALVQRNCGMTEHCCGPPAYNPDIVTAPEGLFQGCPRCITRVSSVKVLAIDQQPRDTNRSSSPGWTVPRDGLKCSRHRNLRPVYIGMPQCWENGPAGR